MKLADDRATWRLIEFFTSSNRNPDVPSGQLENLRVGEPDGAGVEEGPVVVSEKHDAEDRSLHIFFQDSPGCRQSFVSNESALAFGSPPALDDCIASPEKSIPVLILMELIAGDDEVPARHAFVDFTGIRDPPRFGVVDGSSGGTAGGDRSE
jgi:hypothetical protein